MKMELRQRAVDKIFKRRDRIEMPDYQRGEVWTPEKKRLLIDTIFKRWRLPKFYFQKLEDNTYECVDGQQRLTAIWEFFDDKLTLTPETARELGGSKYSELPPDISDAFDDYEIDIEEIEDATDDELEDLFKRLQLGTPLITAERLNAIRGKMRDFCHWVTNQPFFKERIKLRDTRYSHYEIAVRWVFLESRGIEPRVRLPQLESFVRENKSFSRDSQTAKQVTASLRYLEAAFPDKARYLRNKANTLSICMLASRVVKQGLHNRTAQTFGLFVDKFFAHLSAEVKKGAKGKDKELHSYQHAITAASAEADSIKTRLNILTKRLAAFSPEFSGMLSSYEGAEDSAVKSLAEQAEAVRDLIYDVNSKYSTDHGEDLFKMTNKSSRALLNLLKPRRDQEKFGTLIDDLYFLIYEGSGSCNRLPDPKPDFAATDIKFLRAFIRHDLDHGKPAESTANRKKKAAIFKKYSGKNSMGELGPEEFIATQLRLLDATRAFLEALL